MRAYVKKNELLIDTEPNQVGSCPRCPDGVHLAGVAPDVAVLLLDIYNNTLAFCHPASAFCKAHTGQEVLAQLWLSSSTGASAPCTAVFLRALQYGVGTVAMAAPATARA